MRWPSAPLVDLLAEPLRNGRSARTSEDGEGVPVFTLTAVTRNDFSATNVKRSVMTEAEADGSWAEPGDIFIQRSNAPELVGTSALYQGPANFAVFPDLFIRVRPGGKLRALFLLRLLQSDGTRRFFKANARGIAGSMPKISQGTIERVSVPVPGLDEQDRVVAAIETQLSRLDAAVATLRRVKANLKRARASVLKAAVEGRLVPTEAALAFAEGREFEPASVLLERILAERKAAWVASGARGKYAEPATPETVGRAELPEGWCWASMGQAAESLAGHAFHSGDFTRDGVNLLRGDNIDHGSLRWGDRRRCIVPSALAEHAKLQMAAADIVLAMDRPVISTGLKLAIVTPADLPALLVQRVLRLRPRVNHGYLLANLNSPAFVAHLEGNVRGGGVPHISERQVQGFGMPLPPLAEQHRIVAEVDRRLSVLDAIGVAVDANLARCTRLRQSILKRAFEGRLVPPRAEP